jgi:hypothetical protein
MDGHIIGGCKKKVDSRLTKETVAVPARRQVIPTTRRLAKPVSVPNTGRAGTQPSEDFTAEQLKDMSQRRREVLLTRQYGLDPKELEGMSETEISDYYRQIRTATETAKVKGKSKTIFNGNPERIKADFAKRLARRIEKAAERRAKKNNP